MSQSDELQTVEIPPAERDAITADCGERADFLICGRRVRILSNTPQAISDFECSFGDFRCRTAGGVHPDMQIVCRRTGSPAPAVAFLVADRAYRSTHPPILDDLLTTLSYLATVHNRTHYVVHAGCVERNGRAIVLSGASGLGKTTLTTFLVARGMGFLSDERAPIDRGTGMVAPYPMRLGIRPGPAAELAVNLPGRHEARGDDPKKMVDARLLNRSAPDRSLPLHAVVFLTRSLSPGVSTVRKFGGLMRVTFTSMNEDFRRDLLAGTRSEPVADDAVSAGLVSLLLNTRAPDSFLDSLRAVTKRHRVSLVEIRHEDLDDSDFDAEPRLVKLPQAAGLLELVKKIHPAQKAELIRTEFGGSMPPMIEELSRLAKDAGFYKLTPGRLPSMIHIVEALP